jgi:membrane-bound lytic murein transglycosylase D
MKRRLPVHAVVGLCVLFAPAAALCRPQSGASQVVERNAIGDNGDLPATLTDLMRNSRTRYLEGSALIKAGESAKARIAFDEAVDLILLSYWDLPSTPALNSYFQDLIRSIQRDESRYLHADAADEQQPEKAVLDELEDLDLIPIQVDPAFKNAVDADLLNSKYDIPVVVNESVYKAMNYFLSRGRKYFIDGILRSGKYAEMIERIFREESVPPDLMYLAQVESLFKTNALSRAKALGIWQFTKGTGSRYGLKINSYIDERSDPEKSTRAAARYLNDLYAMFNDWSLVLAAYNWGEGKVQSLISKSGVTDFWLLAGLKRRMPKETKNHVPLIMASIILARNPENYGLPGELEAPVAFDRITVSKRISLKTAASTLNVSLDELKQLNPALKTLSTPPNYPDFELKVPAGMGEDFTEKLASLPAVDPKTERIFEGEHRVRNGDTLSGIAARYRTTVAELQAANRLRSPNALRVGDVLQVPARTTVRPAAPAAPPAATNAGSRHQVKSGETLVSIAQFYGVSVGALQQANGMRTTFLRAGTWLQIPSQQTAAGNRL